MSTKKTVYYAHFMGIYNTPQEKRDIETLVNLGFEVINPNHPDTQQIFDDAKLKCNNDYQLAFDNVFGKMVRDADVFAFGGLPNGKIPGGVAIELKIAQTESKPVIELPCSTISRAMGGEETREYLRDMGQR